MDEDDAINTEPTDNEEEENNEESERTYQSGDSGLAMNLRQQKRKDYDVFVKRRKKKRTKTYSLNMTLMALTSLMMKRLYY